MATIAEWMHKEAVQSIMEKSSDLVEEVARMDDEVDRFGFYIVRQLKTALRNPQIIKELGLSSPIDLLGYRLVTKSVERSAMQFNCEECCKGQINKPLSIGSKKSVISRQRYSILR